MLLVTCSVQGCGNKQKASGESIETNEKEEVQQIPAGPVTVDFEQGVDIVKPVSLSQIASDVEYIPLETSSRSLVGKVWENLVLTDEYIFVFGGTNSGFFQFDRKGKFIRKIAKKGQGPGEYVYLSSFIVNEKLRRIYILSSHTWRILVYDFEGNHIKDIQAPKDLRGLSQLDDSRFVTFKMNSSGNEEDRLIIFDSEGTVVQTFPHWEKFTVEGSWNGMIGAPTDRYLYSLNNQVRHKDFYNDTLFTVTLDAMQPEYIIPLGKYAIPPEKRFERIRGDMKVFNTYSDSYFRVNVIEAPAYLFFTYSSWNFTKQQKQRLSLFDKRSGECFTAKDYLIQDDIREIHPFYPVTYSGNRLIGLIQPSDLIESKEGTSKWKEYPALKDLREDSNQVVVVVTLK